jgi:hypothetical protein
VEVVVFTTIFLGALATTSVASHIIFLKYYLSLFLNHVKVVVPTTIFLGVPLIT